MEYNYNKKSIWKWVLLYLVIGAVVYGLVYYFFFYKNGGYSNNNQEINYNNQAETADWKTYRNDKYGFEFKYPNGEFGEGGGACITEFCVNFFPEFGYFNVSGPILIDKDTNDLATTPDYKNIANYTVNGYSVHVYEKYLPFYYNITVSIENKENQWNISSSVSKFTDEYNEQYNKKIEEAKSNLIKITSTFKFTK